MIPRASVLLVLLVALLTAPGLVHAQEADEYFRRGVEALRAGDAERATTMFEKSYALQPRAATLCNLALAYDRWEDHGELAAETYGRCAEEDRSGRFRAHARDRARQIRAELAARAAPGPTDAEATPPSPAPPEARIAPPGPAPPATAGPAPAARTGTWVRGPAPARPPPGPMVVWRVAPPAPPERSHTLLWVGLGSGVLGGAAIAAAVVTVQGVQADADALDEEYDGGDRAIPAGSRDAELLDSARARSDFSIALYAAGGVLAALGVGLILADVARDDAPSPPRTSAALVPLPGGALATVRAELP